MRATTAKVAALLGVYPDAARGLVKFLLEKDLIRPVDVEKRPDGKGKPATVYLFDDDFLDRLVEALSMLREARP